MGGAVILGYHRIADVPADPYSMCVTPRHFAQHMDVIRKHAHPVSLQQLLRSAGEGDLRPGTVVVTFDDGYADFFQVAKPLLEHYEIPSTVFVVSGNLGRQFWWDELAEILRPATRLPSSLHLRVNNHSYTWQLGPSAAHSKQRLLLQLYQVLRRLSEQERQLVVRNLALWAGAAPSPGVNSRAMSRAELGALADSPIIEIGGHTSTHPVLGELPVAAQRREIDDCKSLLEDVVGRPVVSFSYPNGSWAAETPALLRDSGFMSACSSAPGIASRRASRFVLPRCWVEDCDGETFSRWLRIWLT